MGWQHHFTDAIARIEESGLPKSLLRRLLFDSRLTIGSRVLLVGLNDTRLPRLLDELGIDVVGTDDRDDVVATASRAVPSVDVLLMPETGPLPFPAFSFDAVVVRGCRTYGEGLQSARSLRLSGELASLLRPAGELSFFDATPNRLRAAALMEHLECLPGDLRCERFATGWSLSNAVELTSLRIPGTPLDRREWRVLVEAALDARGAAGLPYLDRSAA